MGAHVDFERGTDGVHALVDTAMNRRAHLEGTVDELRRLDADEMAYPVDVAWRFETESLLVRHGGTVRDRSGRCVRTIGSPDPVHLDGACVEIDPVIKLYLTTPDPVTARVDRDGVDLSFEAPSRVTLGARSYAATPAGTVSTTADPEGLAWAVSHFGAAMKSTAPERSFPTLRGRPPAVELGQERVASPGVEMASSAVTVVTEPTVASVLRVAPLAYYLGAPVTLAEEPRVAVDGMSVPLGGTEGATPEQLLQHVFVCDVATRQHGEHGFGCRVATAIEGLLDFETLYDTSHAERMAAYLRASRDGTLEAAPAWPTVAHVAPTAASIEHLPPLVDDLALVRPEAPPTYSGPGARRVALESFVEPGEARGVTQVVDGEASFVDLPETDALFDVWVGDGIPLGGLKSLSSTRRVGSPTDRDGIVNVRLVCNDPEMEPEVTAATRSYGASDTRPFDVSVHRDASVDRLRELLGRDTSLFHFVGHATRAGLECPDGHLDTASVPTVGAETFLLNACESYPHAISLVERGARGGIVTLADVDNESALRAGEHVARALNVGHSLRTVVELLRRDESLGGVYSAVGDTRASIAQSDGGLPVSRVSREGTQLVVRETWFPCAQLKLGSVVNRFDERSEMRLLCAANELRPSEDRFFSLFQPADEAVFVDGSLHWSSDISRTDLP